MPEALDWYIWLILAGRGWGKTRTGAEAIRELERTGRYGRLALVGQTASDVRDVMIEGESGLMSIYPRSERPEYIKSLRVVRWRSGAEAHTYSGDEPDQLRGPQHHAGWCDELAKWKYPKLAWDNLEMGMRLGKRPLIVVTTTPRPTPIIRELVKDPMASLTRGSTYDNLANLAASFKRRMLAKYEGTRLGRQELRAEILDDNPNALWSLARIEELRVDEAPPLMLVVVSVDPQGVHKPGETEEEQENAETGITLIGVGPCNHRCINPDLCTGHGYLLADNTISGSPGEWGGMVCATYHQHAANIVFAEINNGGDMVAHVIQGCDPSVPVHTVRATRGKWTRAEPISNLYAQGRFHHVGVFPVLEDQMTSWQPGMKSPDRMDALVWGATGIFFGGDDTGQANIVEYYDPVRISSI